MPSDLILPILPRREPDGLRGAGSGRVAAFAAGAAAVGFLTAGLATAVGGLSLKPLLLTIFVAGIVPLAAITRQTKVITVAAWIISLTYFRASFPFPSMAGFQGLYVTVADGVFLMALALWLYEVLFSPAPRTAWGPPMLRYALPFVICCFVSALLAQRTDWALYEVLRLARIPLFLLYCRYNLGPREWWVAIVSLGLAVTVQSGFGVLQINGLLGHYQLEAWEPTLRANGTLGHSSLFAGYMLLLGPLFVSLAFSVRDIRLRILCAVPGVMAYVALAVALSRIPWVIAALEIVALTVVAVVRRQILPKHAVALWAVAITVLGLALVPLADKIRNRLQSDLHTAVSWRLRMNEIGLDLFLRHSFFGIGLANFPLYLQNENMEFGDSLDKAMAGILERPSTEAATVTGFHWVWVPHNLYILLLAETGLMGLMSFLVFLGASIRAGLRAVTVPDPVMQAAAIGLLTGIGGVMLQMMTDWALWLDPVLYTFAVCTVLLSNVPGIWRSGQRAAAA